MIRVTDHALVRYVDRHLRIGLDTLCEARGLDSDPKVLAHLKLDCLIDVEAWRAEARRAVAAALDQGEAPGSGCLWHGGLGYVIRDGSLVTVLTEHPKLPKKQRRRPRVRRSGQTTKLLARPGRVARRKALEAAE